jgi:hypothetical protein
MNEYRVRVLGEIVAFTSSMDELREVTEKALQNGTAALIQVRAPGGWVHVTKMYPAALTIVDIAQGDG